MGGQLLPSHSRINQVSSTRGELQLWFGSDIGNVDAFNDNLAAGVELLDALDDIGAPSDELFDQRGSVGISNWLFEQLQSTRVYGADGELGLAQTGSWTVQVLLCAAAPDSASIGFSGSGLVASLTEVYAGRYGLPGKILTDEQLAALQERLDPDGDGLYFVHSGQGDSEDFEVPGVFRMTYTGTSRTCALDISDPGTGEELEFVSSLDGGGFQRVFLDTSVDDISLVYIAGVIGCRNGRVEIGPDGELPEVSEASLDPDGDGFYYVHSGQGDSEAFVVPDTFRVTYTGSSSTCALDIANPRTGAQYEFVSGLDGGGFERVFLDSDLNLVYVADIIGCRGGRLEFVPNS